MAGNIRPSGDGYLVGSFTAAEAIARGQFVYLDDANSVSVAETTARPVIGVALERGYCLALAGEPIAVASGVSELIVGADGRAEEADADFSSTEGFVVGQALADGADGELFPIYCSPHSSAVNFS